MNTSDSKTADSIDLISSRGNGLSTSNSELAERRVEPFICMSLLYLNIQCIRRKINEIEAFLRASKVSFSVLCFVEHWLGADELVENMLCGYNVVDSFSRRGFRRGGVLQCALRDLSSVPVRSVNSLSVEVDCELAAGFYLDFNLLTIVVYRSPNGDFNNFLDNNYFFFMLDHHRC